MDWSKADHKMVERIVQEGESYLSGQLKLATSADQRASVLAGVFTTAGTALLAGLLAFAAAKVSDVTKEYPLFLAGAATVVFFFVAAGLCVAAIFPAGFWLPGNEPKSWYGDIESGKALNDALGEEAEHIQSKIIDNRSTIVRNAERFRWGAILGITAPVVGFVLWAVTSSSYWVAK